MANELAKTEIRHTSPENIIYIWQAIVSTSSPGQSAHVTRVTKYLINEAKYTSEQADEIIATAIKDKLIAANFQNGITIGSKLTKKLLKLPNIQDININKNSYDWYCYECHKPNADDLQRCIQCLRSFHSSCWRIDSDKSNYSIAVLPNRKNVKSFTKTAINKNGVGTGGQQMNSQSNYNNENSVDTSNGKQQQQQQDAIEIDCNEKSTEHYDNDLDQTNESIMIPSDVLQKQENDVESDYQNISSVPVNNYYYLKNETKDDIKLSEIDCICVGEVRPPSRKKCGNQSQSFKSELINRNENNDNETDRKLCSCCRLANKSKLRDPLNKSKEDINYLLRFVFARIKSWISTDTFSPSPSSNTWSMPSKHHMNLFSKLCFKYPKSLAIIDNKLKNDEYTSLTEFQCDFMDIQHCIGILYGLDSYEYQKTDYLICDCLYELSEIRLCHDCYRNSNETESNMYWFCKPCVPRHELVFAKQPSYRYWPAKVVRVVGNQYDVRFFGPKHTRAVVDAKNIKSIDTEIDEMKACKLPTGFKKAMQELQIHLEVLKLPPGRTFETEIMSILLTILGNNFPMMNIMNGGLSLQRNRKRKHHQEQQNQQLQHTQLVNIADVPNTRGNSKRKRKSSHSQNIPIDLIYESENSDCTPALENISSVNASKKVKSSSISLEKTTRNRNTRKSMNTPVLDMSSLNSSSTFNKRSRSKSVHEMNNRILDDEILVTSTQEAEFNGEQRSVKSLNDTVEKFHRELSSIKNLSATKRIALEKFFKTELNQLREQINQLNKQHKMEISAVKRETWCTQCEEVACMPCCWNANYCSVDCQEKHWRTHKQKCNNVMVKKKRNLKMLSN